MMNINKETSILLGKGKNGLGTIVKLVARVLTVSFPVLMKNSNPSFSLIPIKKDRKEFFRK